MKKSAVVYYNETFVDSFEFDSLIKDDVVFNFKLNEKTVAVVPINYLIIFK